MKKISKTTVSDITNNFLPQNKQVKEAAVQAWKRITKEDFNILMSVCAGLMWVMQARDMQPNAKYNLRLLLPVHFLT